MLPEFRCMLVYLFLFAPLQKHGHGFLLLGNRKHPTTRLHNPGFVPGYPVDRVAQYVGVI